MIHSKRLWLIVTALVAVGYFAYVAMQPRPRQPSVAASLPTIESGEAETGGKNLIERPPLYVEPVWDSVVSLSTQTPYKYITAGVIALITVVALKLLKGSKKRGKSKTKLIGSWSSNKVAVLAVVLAVAGGVTAWKVLAATPGSLYGSWSGYVPIRVADYGSGVSKAAFYGAIDKWNKLAGRTILVGSTSNPNVRFFAGSEANWSWTQRYGGVCEIDLGANHRNNVTWVSHELGHCLGFADHVTAREWENYYQLVCDSSSHRYYSPYKGIMSYCDARRGSNLFGGDDLAGLRAFGYTGSSPSSGGNPGSGTSDPCRTVGSNSAGSLNPYSSGNHPTLRQGMSNTCVRHAQWYLMRFYTFTRDIRRSTESGYHPGTIDGKFDSKVTAAVKYYQGKRRISQTGVIDSQTWKLLHQTCSGLKDGGGSRYCYYR